MVYSVTFVPDAAPLSVEVQSIEQLMNISEVQHHISRKIERFYRLSDMRIPCKILPYSLLFLVIRDSDDKFIHYYYIYSHNFKY
jgi:hypothetical protein